MRTAYYIKVLVTTVWLLVCTAVVVYAQKSGTFRKTSYVHNYRLDEPGAIVKCNELAEDANGCIMTATSSGLKIYDGRQWARYYNDTKSELIIHVNVGAHNNIIVSGPECIGYFRPEMDGNMKFHPYEVPFVTRDVQRIACSDNGKTIYVLEDGIYIVDSVLVLKSIENIVASVNCSNGLFLICNNGDLYRYHSELLVKLGNIGVNISAAKMVALDDTKLFVLCNDFTAYEININAAINGKEFSAGDINSMILTNDNIKNCKISDLAYSNYLHRLAVSTNNGIYIYDNNFAYIQKIDKSLNLPINDIVNVFFDSKHNLWASYSGGISKIELNVPYVYYFANQGINSSVLSSYTDGKYFYAGTVSSLFCAPVERAGRNASFEPIEYDVTDGQTFCWDFLGVDGLVLACTSCGVYQIIANKAVRKAITGRTYGAAVSPLYPGKLFVTGFDGFKVLDYTIKNGQIFLSNVKSLQQTTRPLFKIKISDDGTFWCTTLSDGIVRITPKNSQLDDFNVDFIGTTNGLVRTNQLTLVPIGKTLYVNDGLFKRADFGSPESPLVFEPDTVLNKCFDPDEIIYHYVYSPYSDEFFVFSQKACRRISRSNPNINSVIHFRFNVNTVYKLALIDSVLLYSTNFGIIRSDIYDTTFYNPANQPFNVLINGIQCNGENLFNGFRYFDKNAPERNYNIYNQQCADLSYADTVSNLKFDYKDNKIVIRFSSTSFENSESVTYRSKLVGLDTAWSSWGRSPFKEYSKIPHGHYKFMVQARNCEGVESSVATFSFNIVPPFYATAIAIVVYVLLGILLIFLLVKRVTKRLKTRNVTLANLVSERTMQLQEQNEKLRQMSFVATRSTNSVIIMDKDGNIQWTNDSFKNIYGCSYDEFLYIYGKNYFDSYLSNDHKNQELIQLARKSNQNVTYETHHTYFNNTNWVQASLDTVFDDNGQLCNWILTETDITMLKRAQAEGARQQTQLTEAFMQLQESQLQMEVQREQLYVKNVELEKGYKKIEVQNNAITNSLRYAQQMQQSILPLNESISQYFDHFVIYMPKDIVSGDFYWFEPLPDGSLIFVVADCTGHGVPGAFMSLIGYNLLNEIIMIQDITQPKQIFENLSQGLINVLKQERNQNYDGMEVRLCRFVKIDGGYNVTFCGTGSSIFYYDHTTDEMQRIKGVHRHLGLTDETVINNDFEEHQFLFRPGDKLFMITDGLVDQNNPQRKRFGTERFIRFVTQHRNNSVVDTGNTLAAELNAFMDGQPQRDDITVVGLSIKQ